MTFHRKKYIAAAAGFLLLFALTAGVLWFLFQPKSQIILAAAGTYKDSEWVPVLQESQFLKQDDISVNQSFFHYLRNFWSISNYLFFIPVLSQVEWFGTDEICGICLL